jgi:hypothetical protein
VPSQLAASRIVLSSIELVTRLESRPGYQLYYFRGFPYFFEGYDGLVYVDKGTLTYFYIIPNTSLLCCIFWYITRYYPLKINRFSEEHMKAERYL